VPITAGIANLAGVLKIHIAVIDPQGANPAARFAPVDRAALVGGTAIAAATFAVVFAGRPVRAVRPVVRIFEVEASLAVVVGIDISVRDRFAIDDAGARSADTLGAAASSALIAQCAIVRRRPGAEGEIGIADLAIFIWIGDAGIDVLTADVAMRSAGLTDDAAATFGGRTAFAVATNPAGNATAGRLVENRRPGRGALGGIADQATLRRIERSGRDEPAVDLAATRGARFIQAATVRGWAAVAVAADLATVPAKGAEDRRPAIGIERGVAPPARVPGLDCAGGNTGAVDGAPRRRGGIGEWAGESASRGVTLGFSGEPEDARHSPTEGKLEGLPARSCEGSGQRIETRFVHVVPSIPEPLVRR
jgi:hypothetical protein